MTEAGRQQPATVRVEAASEVTDSAGLGVLFGLPPQNSSTVPTSPKVWSLQASVADINSGPSPSRDLWSTVSYRLPRIRLLRGWSVVRFTVEYDSPRLLRPFDINADVVAALARAGASIAIRDRASGAAEVDLAPSVLPNDEPEGPSSTLEIRRLVFVAELCSHVVGLQKRLDAHVDDCGELNPTLFFREVIDSLDAHAHTDPDVDKQIADLVGYLDDLRRSGDEFTREMIDYAILEELNVGGAIARALTPELAHARDEALNPY